MRIPGIISLPQGFVHKSSAFSNFSAISCCFFRENLTRFALYPAALAWREFAKKKRRKTGVFFTDIISIPQQLSAAARNRKTL
jgi:hypothetical protein